MNKPIRCLVLGAAGRDFHDALRLFKRDDRFKLVGFTATQIPYIDARAFPHELIGYDADVPVYAENELERLVAELDVEMVFLAYSDLAHEQVMHLASRVQASGATFALLGPRQTMLESTRPVVSVTAVRTGAGKSPLTQAIAQHLASRGVRAAVLRHPMPYGDLRKQVVQRFATVQDLELHRCTIEEREEYEPYVERGLSVWAGVDYEQVLRAAEAEADVILWDGGNNDYPFVRPKLSIVVVDPLRPGHELRYYPGETNVRMADVVVASKVRSARAPDLQQVRDNVRALNPGALWLEADLSVEVDDPSRVRGKRVLVVEDGPTTTHGGMSWGAATMAAQRCGAAEIVDPRPHAVGSIKRVYEQYPHLSRVLPALGYADEQRADLRATIEASGADLVLDGSPARLDLVITTSLPVMRVRYRFEQLSGEPLMGLVDRALAGG